MVDPLSQIQSGSLKKFDIKRVASVYFNTEGDRCWAKAWFNGHERGEPAKEISRQEAVKFISGKVSKDLFLSRHYPRQMGACRQSVESNLSRLMLNS